MEKAPTPTFLLAEQVGFIFLHTVLNWVIITIQNLSLRCMSFLTHSSVVHDEQPAATKSSTPAKAWLGLSREDVEMIMGRMGLLCSQEEEQLSEYMGCGEFSAMFEDEEPSLEEVRGAFSVFDENRDGFIDAVELERVLKKLGFSEGLGSEECRGMIAAYDENKDGLIDFREFVKFMERGFC